MAGVISDSRAILSRDGFMIVIIIILLLAHLGSSNNSVERPLSLVGSFNLQPNSPDRRRAGVRQATMSFDIPFFCVIFYGSQYEKDYFIKRMLLRETGCNSDINIKSEGCCD